MDKNTCLKCIKKHNGGCCNWQPLFTNEEIAKLFFFKKKLIDSLNLSIISHNNFFQLISNKNTNTCPFLDFEKGCLIYEYRPKICRDFAEKIGNCIMKDGYLKQISIKEATKYLKDYISNQKFKKPIKSLSLKNSLKLIKDIEFAIFIIIAEQISDLEIFKEKKYYSLVIEDDKLLPSEFVFVETKIKELKLLEKIKNFIIRKIILLHNDVIDIYQNKLNNILKNVDYLKISNDELINKILFSYLMLRYFKLSFKKKEKYKGLIVLF